MCSSHDLIEAPYFTPVSLHASVRALSDQRLQKSGGQHHPRSRLLIPQDDFYKSSVASPRNTLYTIRLYPNTAGSVMASPQKVNCRDSVAADKRDPLVRLLRGRGTSEQKLLALAQCNTSEKYHALFLHH